MQEGEKENTQERKQIFEHSEIVLIQNMSSCSDFLKKDLQFAEYFNILCQKLQVCINVFCHFMALSDVLCSVNLIRCLGYLLYTKINSQTLSVH